MLPDDRLRTRLRALNRRSRTANVPEIVPSAVAPEASSGLHLDAPLSRRRSASGAISALRLSLDLHLLILAAAAIPLVMLTPYALLRVPFGVLVVLIVPGYALASALFLPEDEEASGTSRLAISIGLSLATVPMIALAIHLSPVVIDGLSVPGSLVAWILFWVAVSAWRRSAGLDGYPEQRETPIVGHRFGFYGGIIAFLVVLSLGTGLALSVLPGWSTQSSATEFYMLGAAGEARDYPRTVTVGEPVAVTIGIINNDDSTQGYLVEVWAGDLHETQSAERLSRFGPIHVDANGVHHRLIDWQMPVTGTDRVVTIVLSKENDGRPHRTLRLVLDVVDVEST